MPCLIFTCIVFCILARINGLNDFFGRALSTTYLLFVGFYPFSKCFMHMNKDCGVIEVIQSSYPVLTFRVGCGSVVP